MNDEIKDEVCAECGADIPGDEVVWIDEDGNVELTGEGADPYHENCAP